MDGSWETLDLPFPNSSATHTLFYKMISALEVEVYNVPLADNSANLKNKMKEIFSLFGHVDEVTLDAEKDTVVVKFETQKGIERAMIQKRKHAYATPDAFAGEFGLDRYINKYRTLHPDIETLERVSSEIIAQFEEIEKQNKMVSGRKVVRMTEAEKKEYMNRYQEKAKKMQSGDFYAFQQRDRPNLATALLTNEVKALHMKKKPKKKHQQQQQQQKPNEE